MDENKVLACYPNPDQILARLSSSTQKCPNKSILWGYQGIINQSYSNSLAYVCAILLLSCNLYILHNRQEGNRTKVDQGHLPCCPLMKTLGSPET
jgi:hypothetical protein